MNYKAGDRVKIKSLDWYNENKDANNGVRCGNFTFYAAQYCGFTVTIALVNVNAGCYIMKEIDDVWTDEMIEGLVEEEIIDIDDFQDDNEIIDIIDEYVHRLKNNECQINLLEGYQFTDENGNVINATKIVLEKKKKDVNLTQEQINTIIHDSCVLFCKHCGCGIPRETCISLGTCKEYDEYRAAMRTHLMKKKKKEYPKTYEECCKVLNTYCGSVCGYNWKLLLSFQQLLICRDAYWKIAGEEMGLGKPWEPDWNTSEPKYVIACTSNGIEKQWETTYCKGFAFPTEEMRDAFYENFKELIEICKELL